MRHALRWGEEEEGHFGVLLNHYQTGTSATVTLKQTVATTQSPTADIRSPTST